MPIDRQRVFEQVARHLLTQNERSVGLSPRLDSSAEKCLLRAGHLKCAIGCLILDQYYYPTLETGNLGSQDWIAALRLSGWDYEPYTTPGDCTSDLSPDYNLLFELQRIHDGGTVFSWRERLEQLAVTHHFAWPADLQ
jgi:hypothetical protein